MDIKNVTYVLLKPILLWLIYEVLSEQVLLYITGTSYNFKKV